jgi:hypothetical protein
LIRTWSADQIIQDLYKCYHATTDPRMDGYTTWPCKQDLYRVKFELDSMLKKCPTYAPEQEWLEEHNKKLVWQALSDKL